MVTRAVWGIIHHISPGHWSVCRLYDLLCVLLQMTSGQSTLGQGEDMVKYKLGDPNLLLPYRTEYYCTRDYWTHILLTYWHWMVTPSGPTTPIHMYIYIGSG